MEGDFGFLGFDDFFVFADVDFGFLTATIPPPLCISPNYNILKVSVKRQEKRACRKQTRETE